MKSPFSWFGRMPKTSTYRRPRRTHRPGPRLACEALEDRRLLAGFGDSLVPGVFNTYRDVSHEHVYYQDGSKGLQAGDIVLGYLELETDTTTGAPPLTKHSTYILFSVEVAGFSTPNVGQPSFGAVTSDNTQSEVVFKPVPAADPSGLSLQEILGQVSTTSGPQSLPDGTVAAIFDQTGGAAYPDLVNVLPPGTTTANAQMQDWFKYIEANGTFEVGGGFTGTNQFQASNGKSSNDDFFVSVTNAPANTFTSSFVNSLPSSLTFGTNFGGLSVTLNNTSFNFAKTVVTQDLLPHQIGVSQASESGGNTESNFANWGLVENPPGTTPGDGAAGNPGPSPSTSKNDAGTTDNATFTFAPANPTPQIQIVKLTNGTNNDGAPVAGTPDGPLVPFGGTVTWTYNVTATGSQEPIKNVNVTDSVAGVNPTPVLSGGFNVGDTNQNGLLDPGETWVYQATGTAILGQYSNVGTVTGNGNISNTPVTANNPDHYFGVDAFISITPAHPYNEVGHAETFTITVTALPGTSQLNAADVSFATPTVSYPGLTPDLSGPATATFVSRTGNVATYSLTINSDTPGTFEVKASDDIKFTSPLSPNSLTLTRTTGDGVSQDSPDALKTYEDAYVTIAPNGTNEVGKPHTFTATVFENLGDGNGYVKAPDGTTVVITLSNSNGAVANPAGPFTLTTVNGSASVTFTSATAGTVTGNASIDVTLNGVELTRSTGDGVSQDSPNAVKVFEDAYVTITPNGTNVVGNPHTFTATVFENLGDGKGYVTAPKGTPLTITLSNSNGAVANPAGPFSLTTDANGQASVTFTSATAGVVTGNASIDLTLNGVELKRQTGDKISQDSGPATKVFEDEYITITPPFASNPVNAPHTFTATVFLNTGDGTGFHAVGAGTSVTVTLTSSLGSGASITQITPANGTVNGATVTYTLTTDSNGQVAVTFSSTTAQTITGHASTTLTIPSGGSITRATGDQYVPGNNGGVGDSPDAVKTFISLATTPFVVTTTGSSGGTFATIGFWHNKNGQAVINSFDSGPSSTKLGNSLASNYGNLFGFANPYDTGTLGTAPGTAPGLAGLTNAQVAAVYLGLWTPSGVVKNTYVQAFAVAFGLYATGSTGNPPTFNVGNNGAAFGVANGTTLTVAQILKAANDNFDPTTGLFYGGDQAKTSALNNVLDGINSSGENPGGSTVVSSSAMLNDTATLAGTTSSVAGDTITFYLMPPGSTASTPLTSAVYKDVITIGTNSGSVTGNGTYSTATMGNNSGGYAPAATGTYQWVVVFSGDGTNSGVTSPFGSEPWVVGSASLLLTTTPNPTSVTLGTSNVVLKDTATLSGGVNPTGTITFTLYSPTNTLLDTETVTVNGNGNYTTPTGFTLTPGAMTGTYQWDAVYTSGDSNNNSDSDLNNPGEQVVVSAKSPGTVGAGDFATIGFWHNKNGQAVINSFNGGSTQTALGTWLATNFPHLFGSPNPYDSATLASFGATTLAGLTNAQIATVYENLWNPSGVTKNTYVQAFAVALGMYADTGFLGYDSTAASFGFKMVVGGGGQLTFGIGGNGAAFPGLGSNPTVLQIMQAVDGNFDPTTGNFYGGDQTKTSDANNVLNGINTKGDISAMSAAGSSNGGDSVLLSSYSNLHTGTLLVSVDIPDGPNAAGEQARVDDAIANINNDLASFGVTLVEVPADQSASADVTLTVADTTVIGGVADGVLGVTEIGGSITLVDGWNWYLGSDASQIGSDQYDFETVATHELGHAIGLGHSTDSASVMYPYLGTSETRRDLTANDVGVIETAKDNGPEPLLAAGFTAPGVRAEAAPVTAVTTGPALLPAAGGLAPHAVAVEPTVASTAFTATSPRGTSPAVTADAFAGAGMAIGQAAPFAAHDLGLQAFLQDRGSVSDVAMPGVRTTSVAARGLEDGGSSVPSVTLRSSATDRAGDQAGLESLGLASQGDDGGPSLPGDLGRGADDLDMDSADSE
jgi:hypothetical protein